MYIMVISDHDSVSAFQMTEGDRDRMDEVNSGCPDEVEDEPAGNDDASGRGRKICVKIRGS